MIFYRMHLIYTKNALLSLNTLGRYRYVYINHGGHYLLTFWNLSCYNDIMLQHGKCVIVGQVFQGSYVYVKAFTYSIAKRVFQNA